MTVILDMDIHVGVAQCIDTGKWLSVCHYGDERRSEEFDTEEEARAHAETGAARMKAIAATKGARLVIRPLVPDVTEEPSKRPARRPTWSK